MKVEDYISSGILESYVMGLTSPWENLQVEAMIAKHPEIKAEVLAIENSLIALAEAAAVKPAADVKDKTYSAVTGEPLKTTAKVIDIATGRSKGTTILKWAVAASIALLLGSAALNYYLYNKLEKSNVHLAHLESEHALLNNNFTALQTNLDQTKEQLTIYEDANVKMICLMGINDTTGSLAHVYWDTNSKAVFVEVNHLPAVADTMEYKLWAIEAGVPKSAGLLTSLELPVQKMETVQGAEAFAISLERKGSTALLPEGKIYLSGNI